MAWDNTRDYIAPLFGGIKELRGYFTNGGQEVVGNPHQLFGDADGHVRGFFLPYTEGTAPNRPAELLPQLLAAKI